VMKKRNGRDSIRVFKSGGPLPFKDKNLLVGCKNTYHAYLLVIP